MITLTILLFISGCGKKVNTSNLKITLMRLDILFSTL